MKPSIANLAKAAARSGNPEDLRVLSDHAGFFVAGARAAAELVGRPVRSAARIEALLDEARRVRDLIDERIRILERPA